MSDSDLRNGLMYGKGIFFSFHGNFHLVKTPWGTIKWNTKLRSRNKEWAGNKPHLV